MNSQAMQAEPSDVHVTLEYRVDAELADWLPIGVLTVFCGLFLFAIAQPGLPPLGETVGASAAIVVGIGIAALALWRRFRRGGPVYVLSPIGVHYRGPWMKEIVIPWHEIKSVDTIDVEWRHWITRHPADMTSRGVTVVLVSKPSTSACPSVRVSAAYWSDSSSKALITRWFGSSSASVPSEGLAVRSAPNEGVPDPLGPIKRPLWERLGKPV